MLPRAVTILLIVAAVLASGCGSSDIEPGPRHPSPDRGTDANPLNLPTP
ncbi:MAG: hypothetical protein GVY16_00565 [Planctomycetes bacterium]|nr:hypothetical protein [Phycisphaerae bacterium]NBB94218.1 hypothetical protein [Planctomycetota bacterium]